MSTRDSTTTDPGDRRPAAAALRLVPADPAADAPTTERDPLTSRSWEVPSQAPPPGGVMVQKFGGSSLADASGVMRAARRIAGTLEDGFQVVAVVSAMGDTTDELSDLALELSARPRPADLDALLSIGELVSSALLAIALAELGKRPRTFTGAQAGVVTDSMHGRARITGVRPARVRASLDRGEVPIIAGFQGRTKKGKVVTTLGRGGSDLTAVALAAALDACMCEIYTDVDGVYSADPRIVPTARKISGLSSEEMLELAASGCKVLQARCVGYASRFGVPIHVRSSFVAERGTLILPGSGRRPFVEPVREHAVVAAVAVGGSVGKFSVGGLPDGPTAVLRVGRLLSESGVNVEAVRSAPRTRSGRSDVVLIVPVDQVASALGVLRAARPTIGFETLQHDGQVGRLSVTGTRLQSSPEVLRTLLGALATAGIDFELVDVSETRIGGIIRCDQLAEAERVVLAAFGRAAPAEHVSSDPPATETIAAGLLASAWTAPPEKELVTMDSRLA